MVESLTEDSESNLLSSAFNTAVAAIDVIEDHIEIHAHRQDAQGIFKAFRRGQIERADRADLEHITADTVPRLS